MLWWVGSGLIVLWLILLIVGQRGWLHIILLSGISVLIIQLAAHRKTKSVRNLRH